MELKKGYKLTEVGIIPNDWKVDDIGNVVSITTGAKNTQDRIEDGTYPFFVRSQTIERIDSYSFDGEGVLTAGDGVGTGKIFHYINGKFDFHQRVYLMHSFKQNLNGYFFYLYFKQNFYSRIMQMTAKSSVDSVRREMISKMKLPLPPIHEQTAIATALSDADALITSLERLIAKKRHIKQGAMQQLLKPKKGWVVKRLGEIGKCLRGVSYNPERDLYPHDKEVTVRLLRSNNVQNQTLEFSGLQYVDNSRVKPNQILKDNDIIICMANGSKQLVGKSASFKKIDSYNYTFGAFMGCFRVDDNLASSSFIALTFQSYRYRSFIDVLLSGSSINNLNPTNIESIEFPFPPIQEQEQIAKLLLDMDYEIITMEQKLEKCKFIKQGMMQNLISGKIRLI